jgi:hypothetical protein
VKSVQEGTFREHADTTRDMSDEPDLRGTFTPRPNMLEPEAKAVYCTPTLVAEQ